MNAFVPGYKFDIFISYARVDNIPVPGINMRWVSHLMATLDIILAQTLGREDLYRPWMDIRQSEDKARLTPEIREKVEKSATFLMILSPGYLGSPWCREGHWFSSMG